MTYMENAYENALLADATYALEKNDLQGKTGKDLSGLLKKRMTPTLAQYIGENFTVVTHIETSDVLGSGFDATVWKHNGSGKLFVSMQGTTGLQDFLTDVNLATSGSVRAQLASMINWWLRTTTPKGESARQIQAAGSLYIEALPVAGTGLISAAELAQGIEVNGHSLGGFLAQAFTAHHDSAASAAYTFNALGMRKNAMHSRAAGACWTGAGRRFDSNKPAANSARLTCAA